METHHKIGQCRFLLRQHDPAIRALERGHALDPRDPRLLSTFATVLVEAGFPARALPLALEATRLDPTSADAWDTLGQAYLGLSDKAKAGAAFRRALELDPHHPEAKAALRKLGQKK